MNAAAPTAPRGRLQLVLLATLFFFPLLASYAVYFWFPQFRPTGTTNYGVLVQPAAQPVPTLELRDADDQSLDETVLKGRWTYLMRAPAAICEQECLQALIMTRQVRLSLNEKRPRVQRILLAPDADSARTLAEALAAEHPDLLIVREPAEPVLAQFLDAEPGLIHLFDPLGNWLMRYPGLLDGPEGTREDFKGIRKDIKKLLRISQIG